MSDDGQLQPWSIRMHEETREEFRRNLAKLYADGELDESLSAAEGIRRLVATFNENPDPDRVTTD